MKASKPLTFDWISNGGTMPRREMVEVEITAGQKDMIVLTNQKTEVINFGVNDNYGREIGAVVRTFEQDLVPFEKDPRVGCYTGGMSLKPGHYFMADVQAARKGMPYGACQPRLFFATSADRDSYLSTRLIQMRKAATKKAVA